MNAADIAAWAEDFHDVTIDLGAGDGRFVRHLGLRRPAAGAIGVELCPDNLRTASRAAPDNVLFVIGDALALPGELSGIATRLTINFPWGSLLRGLLDGHPELLAGLRAVSRSAAPLEIRLNAGALAEAGWSLDAGGEALTRALRDAGIKIDATTALGAADLRQWPTTWAKRLAFGRDPRAWLIEASLSEPDDLAWALPHAVSRLAWVERPACFVILTQEGSR
ncbi:MAG TPA: hypothetical protein VFQ80_12100, partial [Thermomicrobiales bacterium]|nr:hypothetical protein [Thermomicrobiales bacterium]